MTRWISTSFFTNTKKIQITRKGVKPHNPSPCVRPWSYNFSFVYSTLLMKLTRYFRCISVSSLFFVDYNNALIIFVLLPTYYRINKHILCLNGDLATISTRIFLKEFDTTHCSNMFYLPQFWLNVELPKKILRA